MRAPAAALLLALLLAGCGARDDAPPTPLVEEADTLLRDALASLPAIFSLDMSVRTSNGTLLSYSATFDEDANTTWIRLGGDATTLSAIGGAAGAGTYLAHGLTVYRSGEAILYLANGTAFVRPPPDPSKTVVGSALPMPEQGPLGKLLRGDDLVRGFADARVVNATTSTWEGADAIEMIVEREADDARSTLLVTRADPPRIVRLQTSIPADPAQPASPIADAELFGTLLYDERVIRPEAAATRALGLAYVSSRREGNLTWTFTSSASVRLNEVEVQVKRPGNASVADPSLLPTVWSFPFDRARHTVGNLTLAFLDLDGDGAVSRGDTLVATAPNAASLPPLVLYDLATGTRILPASGFVVALMALLLALWARHR